MNETIEIGENSRRVTLYEYYKRNLKNFAAVIAVSIASLLLGFFLSGGPGPILRRRADVSLGRCDRLFTVRGLGVDKLIRAAQVHRFEFWLQLSWPSPALSHFRLRTLLAGRV